MSYGVRTNVGVSRWEGSCPDVNGSWEASCMGGGGVRYSSPDWEGSSEWETGFPYICMKIPLSAWDRLPIRGGVSLNGEIALSEEEGWEGGGGGGVTRIIYM